MSLSRQSLALVLTTNKNQTHKTKHSDPICYLSYLKYKKIQKHSEAPSL